MIDCKDCYWSNADTCRICKQGEHAVGLSDAFKEASEKGDITIYSVARLEGTFEQILDKINGRVNGR